MRTKILTGLLDALAFCLPLMAFEQPAIYQLKPKDRVLILGDSTTSDGIQPAGYVQLVEQAQREQILGMDVKVWGYGFAMKGTWTLLGDRGYVNGYVKSLLGKEGAPTVVIINLGLNDSKSGINGVVAFVENLRQAVDMLRTFGVTVILCTPTTWGGLSQTKPYAEAGRTLAAELKCPVIDLYAVHAEQIAAHTKDGVLTPGANPTRDGAHLNGLGETLSASAILQSFDLKPIWQKYQLRVRLSRNGKGKILVELDASAYPAGTKVTLTVIPEPGSEFAA